MVDLTLKSDLGYDAPQGMQGSYDAIMKQNAQQNQLIDAIGGGRRRRIRNRTKRVRKMNRPIRGGEVSLPPYPNSAPAGRIEVQPLPLGSQSGNTQANNIQNATTYAASVQNATGDKYVGEGISPSQNGGSVRRTRKRRGRKTRRTKRMRVNAKKRKSRRTRRYRK